MLFLSHNKSGLKPDNCTLTMELGDSHSIYQRSRHLAYQEDTARHNVMWVGL